MFVKLLICVVKLFISVDSGGGGVSISWLIKSIGPSNDSVSAKSVVAGERNTTES